MKDRGRTRRKVIQVKALARVEGEGALYVKVTGNRVSEVRLNIYEPPRFFEAFLRGRAYHEAPDITARICGICPVAYQMSAIQAMESLMQVQVPPEIVALRRLIYCGEWIQSHLLHIFFLHAPDFLGYQSALDMAREHPRWVQAALALKKLGNRIMALVGGREVHPINVRVGGFYHVPPRKEFEALLPELEAAGEKMKEAISFLAGLPFPDLKQDYEFVALHHPQRYAIMEGKLVSNRGLSIEVPEFEEHFQELQVPHSNALHAIRLGGGAYLVGPLARFNLNFDQLHPEVQSQAREIGMTPPCYNPFQSILARALEVRHAFLEAISLIENLRIPDPPAVPVSVQAGTGYGCTEAPRGILYHRYVLDEQGIIQEAKIVPPTSQNQKMMEEDLRKVVEENLEMPHEALTWRCEQTIRNYDPCISCATHFLRLTVERV